MSDENQITPNTVVVTVGTLSGRPSANVDTVANTMGHFDAHYLQDGVPPELRVDRLAGLRFCTLDGRELRPVRNGVLGLEFTGGRANTTERCSALAAVLRGLRVSLDAGYGSHHRTNPFPAVYGDWDALSTLIREELAASAATLEPPEVVPPDDSHSTAVGPLSVGSWLHNLIIHGGHPHP